MHCYFPDWPPRIPLLTSELHTRDNINIRGDTHINSLIYIQFDAFKSAWAEIHTQTHTHPHTTLICIFNHSRTSHDLITNPYKKQHINGQQPFHISPYVLTILDRQTAKYHFRLYEVSSQRKVQGIKWDPHHFGFEETCYFHESRNRIDCREVRTTYFHVIHCFQFLTYARSRLATFYHTNRTVQVCTLRLFSLLFSYFLRIFLHLYWIEMCSCKSSLAENNEAPLINTAKCGPMSYQSACAF